jgi:ATP-dependent Clp protease ATP-binding subunit ClpC
LKRLSDKARAVMECARKEAACRGAGVSTEHILLALLEDSEGARLLAHFEISVELIRRNVERQAFKGEPKDPDDIGLNQSAKQVTYTGYAEADNMESPYIEPVHLFLGVIEDKEDLGGRVLAKLGMEAEKTRRAIITLMKAGPADTDQAP